MAYRNNAQPKTLPAKWAIPVDLGFSVIPVEPGGKKPLLDEWKSYMTSAADRATVAGWAANNNCNVGIVTGRVSGLTILDFDTAEAEAKAKALGLPETVTVKTNRGRHYYFAYPDRPVRKPQDFPRGMDIKSEGGMVVAPGSLHPSGAIYEWENDPAVYPLAELPGWLVGSPENERQDARGERYDDAGGEITPEVLADLASALQTISAAGYDEWIAVGVALSDLPDDLGKQMWVEWSATCPTKFDQRVCDERWATFTADRTGYRAIFARAQKDWGWKNPNRHTPRDARDAFADPDEDTPPPTDADAFWIDLGPKELRPTEFVLDGFLPTGVSSVAGAWGAGKSTCLIPLLASAAHITPEGWGFWPVLRRKVVWVSEAPDQARDVLYSISEADGAASWDEVREWFLLCRARRRQPKALAKVLKEMVAKASYSLANGFVVHPVVVLDTSAANVELENESDNSMVSQAMATLKQSLPGVSIVIVGHTPKALVRADVQDATFRGAGAWEADAVATYALVYDDKTDTRFLAVRKCRFSPQYREIEFDHEGGSKIVDTPWGDPQVKAYLHGVPHKSSGEARRAAHEEAKAQAEARAISERQQKVLDHLREFISDTRLPTKSAIASAVGGKRELAFAAIDRLMEAGTVAVHMPSKDEIRAATGATPKGPPPEVIFPTDADFEAFLTRMGEGNQ